MKEFTKNRGPDADGIYLDDDITISHDRLSILDLNSNANQPMRFKDYVISFNGEIYNFKDLRKQLEDIGYKFKTNSDTEVILYLFDKYGVEAFKKLSGIFAICIWSIKEKVLYLIRDTIGVKPLYYYQDSFKSKFFFSSSIKSILISLKNKEINDNAFVYYSNFGRNDKSETIFKNIFKLMPGELIIFKKNKLIKKKFLNIDLKYNKLSNEEIKFEIEKNIENQLISDVPLALSLSGGVDSNIVYSVMRKKLSKNFNIYSFYFKDWNKFNEDYNVAKENSHYYKNNFIPVEIGHSEFIENCEKVVEILEEPSANQCSILNYCMSKKIDEKILVTGDGGDETFTGYDRYRSIHIIYFLQKFNILKNINLKTKYKNFNRLFMTNPKDLYLSFSEQNFYKDLKKYFLNFKSINQNDIGLNHLQNQSLKKNLNSISLLDLDTIVPNEYLLRNDKIFMNEGIEVRVPLLDINIINQLLMTNDYRKYGYMFKNKALMKNIFKNEIYKLVKKKWGLQSPYAKWMMGPLQKFLKEVLSSGYYENSSKLLNFIEINKLIDEHREKYYNPELLWYLVIIQVFLRKFKL